MPTRPFIAAPDTASVELYYIYMGQYFMNVFHCFKGTTYSLADLVAVRGIFDAWDSASWKIARPEGSLLYRIRSKALDTNSGPVDDYSLPVQRPGTGTGLTLPPATTFAIKLQSNRAGRSYRGRVYIPGVSQNMTGGGTGGPDIGWTLANSMVAALNTLIANLAAGGHTLCITSYRTEKAWRAIAHNEPVAQAVFTHLHLDVQRRRAAGRGN